MNDKEKEQIKYHNVDTNNNKDSLQIYLKSKLTIMDENDKVLPIYLVGIGEDFNENVSRKNGFMRDQIFLIDSGKGELIFGDKKINLSQRSCVFIPKNIPYSYITIEKPFKLYWICFEGSYLTEMLSYFKLTDVLHFQCHNFKKLLSLHQELYFMTENHYDPVLFSKYVYSLLIDFYRQKVASSVNIKSLSEITPVKNYIDTHFIDDISLDFLEKEFHLSKYKICRYFSEIYNISYHEYLVKLRLQYAKHLLTTTNLSVQAISVQCGYYDNVYFGKVFKKYESISPQKYRMLLK